MNSTRRTAQLGKAFASKLVGAFGGIRVIQVLGVDPLNACYPLYMLLGVLHDILQRWLCASVRVSVCALLQLCELSPPPALALSLSLTTPTPLFIYSP
jgi:hypothetical protein